jgi:hypothetical protein
VIERERQRGRRSGCGAGLDGNRYTVASLVRH